jgi:hypothetical protein
MTGSHDEKVQKCPKVQNIAHAKYTINPWMRTHCAISWHYHQEMSMSQHHIVISSYQKVRKSSKTSCHDGSDRSQKVIKKSSKMPSKMSENHQKVTSSSQSKNGVKKIIKIITKQHQKSHQNHQTIAS